MGAAVPWPAIPPRQRLPAPVMPWSMLTLRTAPCTTSLPLPCTAVSLCNTYRLAEHCNFVSAMPSFTMLEDPGASAAQLGSQLDLHGEDHAPAQAQHIKSTMPNCHFCANVCTKSADVCAQVSQPPGPSPYRAPPISPLAHAQLPHTPAGSAFKRVGERLDVRPAMTRPPPASPHSSSPPDYPAVHLPGP